MGHKWMLRRGLLVAPLLVLAAACSESSRNVAAPDFALRVGNNNAYCTELMAGQSTDAGSVCATVDGDYLKVTYTTEGGWQLTESHLWVGTQWSQMPQTRTGNPKIGNFPYNSGPLNGATTYTVSVDLRNFGLNSSMTTCQALNLFVAAHAALRKPNGDGTYQTETGWGDGVSLVQRGSWAEGFAITINCYEDTPPAEYHYETAFAYGASAATCFLNFDFDNDGRRDFSRWGWSNGPIAAGTYTYDIYAAAGQCSLSNGTRVGTLTVAYSGSTATVTFTMLPGYVLDETHLYVGSEPLARDVNNEYTVAPGQYPVQHDLTNATTDSDTVTGLSGSVYVVAHAVVGFPQ